MCGSWHEAETPSDKQMHVDMDTTVSFVIQSGQVSEGKPISMSHQAVAYIKPISQGKQSWDIC